ncbi:hypothetical protein ACVWW5_007331 [Bradyrhizobium sp. LM3.4]
MTEVLVDQSRALGCNRHQHLDCAGRAGEPRKLLLLGRKLCNARLLDFGLILPSGLLIILDVHGHDLFHGELRAAVLPEQSDGVGAALATMTHHVHLAFAAILQCCHFLCGRAALPAETEHGAVLGR